MEIKDTNKAAEAAATVAAEVGVTVAAGVSDLSSRTANGLAETTALEEGIRTAKTVRKRRSLKAIIVVLYRVAFAAISAAG